MAFFQFPTALLLLPLVVVAQGQWIGYEDLPNCLEVGSFRGDRQVQASGCCIRTEEEVVACKRYNSTK